GVGDRYSRGDHVGEADARSRAAYRRLLRRRPEQLDDSSALGSTWLVSALLGRSSAVGTRVLLGLWLCHCLTSWLKNCRRWLHSDRRPRDSPPSSLAHTHRSFIKLQSRAPAVGAADRPSSSRLLVLGLV